MENLLYITTSAHPLPFQAPRPARSFFDFLPYQAEILNKPGLEKSAKNHRVFWDPSRLCSVHRSRTVTQKRKPEYRWRWSIRNIRLFKASQIYFRVQITLFLFKILRPIEWDQARLAEMYISRDITFLTWHNSRRRQTKSKQS